MMIFWYSSETEGSIKNIKWINKVNEDGRKVWELYNGSMLCTSPFRIFYPDIYHSLHVTVDPRS